MLLWSLSFGCFPDVKELLLHLAILLLKDDMVYVCLYFDYILLVHIYESWYNYFITLFRVLRFEPRTFCMLGNHSYY